MDDQELRFQRILQNSPLNAFKECLHASVDDICGRRGAPYESFKSITNWELEDYKTVIHGVKKLVIEVAVNQLADNQIKEKIPELDSTRQEMVLECLSVRQKDIQNILLQEKCAISGPVLQDFDWNVKWVMGSSKSSSLREPLLSLDLHLSEGRNLRKNGIGIKEKTVSLELDKEELNKLISMLEKAQESVTSFQN